MGQDRILKTDLDYLFSLSHLGSGTPDSAGTVTLISLSQVDFITIISWNWLSIGLLCFLSLQTLKERTF